MRRNYLHRPQKGSCTRHKSQNLCWQGQNNRTFCRGDSEDTVKTQTETPKDTNQDSPKTTKEKKKKRGGKAKLPVEFTEETTKTQPLKDTKTDSVQITKAETCVGKATSPPQFAEDTEIKPEAPEIPTQASIQTKNAKRSPGRAKSTEKFTDGVTKMPENTLKDTACVAQDRNEDKAAVDSILYTTLEKLKIRKSKRSDAAGAINKIMNTITTHLKQKTESFKEANQLRTGSYYENLKVSHFSSSSLEQVLGQNSWCVIQMCLSIQISNPDEFDIMIVIPVERVNIKPFGDGAFYSVALKQGNSPLQRFQEDTLSASKMLEKFREEVKKSVKESTGGYQN